MRRLLFILMFLPLMSMGQEKSLVSKARYYSLEDNLVLFDYNYISEMITSGRIKINMGIVVLEREGKKEYYLELSDARQHGYKVNYGKTWISYQELTECIGFVQKMTSDAIIDSKGGEHDYVYSIIECKDFKIQAYIKAAGVKWYIRIGDYFGENKDNPYFEDYISLDTESQTKFLYILQRAKTEIDRLMSVN